MHTTMNPQLTIHPGVYPLSQSVARRSVRLWTHLATASLLVAASLYVSFHAYIAWTLSNPAVAPLSSNPMAAKQLPYEDVTFPSSDGSTLVDGWWIPAAGSSRTVVLSHGYGANREEYWVPMYDIAELLHRMEYNVLMFDYAFANPDRYKPATGGYRESLQLLGALQYVRERGTRELVVWGFSMGAGTALQAALRSEPDAIDGMILDSLFLPDENTVYHNISQHIRLPREPSLQLIRLFFPLWSGAWLEQIPAAEAQSTAFPFPVLLIHGTADEKAPVYLAENVAGAQTNPQSGLWVVPDAIHEMIFRTHHDEYVRRTADFLNRISPSAFGSSNVQA